MFSMECENSAYCGSINIYIVSELGWPTKLDPEYVLHLFFFRPSSQQFTSTDSSSLMFADYFTSSCCSFVCCLCFFHLYFAVYLHVPSRTLHALPIHIFTKIISFMNFHFMLSLCVQANKFVVAVFFICVRSLHFAVGVHKAKKNEAIQNKYLHIMKL